MGGEKGRSQLRRMVPDSLTTALTNIPPPYNFGYASTVAQMALDTEPEKTGAIAVVYNKFVSAIAYSPTLKTIAPFVLEGDDVTLTLRRRRRRAPRPPRVLPRHGDLLRHDGGRHVGAVQPHAGHGERHEERRRAHRQAHAHLQPRAPGAHHDGAHRDHLRRVGARVEAGAGLT